MHLLNSRNRIPPSFTIQTFNAAGSTVSIVFDAASRLPANGGLRIQEYPCDQSSVEECLTLATLMDQKHRLYNTGFSGGKIVVNAPPEKIRKADLLGVIGVKLNRLAGRMYTGCDLNTSPEDIAVLAETTPYILAGLNSTHSPHLATARGVLSTIKTVLAHRSRLGVQPSPRIVVVGCGQVGRPLVIMLAQLGIEYLLTADIIPQRASIGGATNISSAHQRWSFEEVDLVVVCAGSGVITANIARTLDCKAIVSATNAPCDSSIAQCTLAQKGVLVVPDFISNSGAVICDSIEHYNPTAFAATEPERVYQFVEDLIASKSEHYISGVLNGSYTQSTFEALGDNHPRVCGRRFV